MDNSEADVEEGNALKEWSKKFGQLVAEFIPIAIREEKKRKRQNRDPQQGEHGDVSPGSTPQLVEGIAKLKESIDVLDYTAADEKIKKFGRENDSAKNAWLAAQLDDLRNEHEIESLIKDLENEYENSRKPKVEKSRKSTSITETASNSKTRVPRVQEDILEILNKLTQLEISRAFEMIALMSTALNKLNNGYLMERLPCMRALRTIRNAEPFLQKDKFGEEIDKSLEAIDEQRLTNNRALTEQEILQTGIIKKLVEIRNDSLLYEKAVGALTACSGWKHDTWLRKQLVTAAQYVVPSGAPSESETPGPLQNKNG